MPDEGPSRHEWSQILREYAAGRYVFSTEKTPKNPTRIRQKQQVDDCSRRREVEKNRRRLSASFAGQRADFSDLPCSCGYHAPASQTSSSSTSGAQVVPSASSDQHTAASSNPEYTTWSELTDPQPGPSTFSASSKLPIPKSGEVSPQPGSSRLVFLPKLLNLQLHPGNCLSSQGLQLLLLSNLHLRLRPLRSRERAAQHLRHLPYPA